MSEKEKTVFEKIVDVKKILRDLVSMDDLLNLAERNQFIAMAVAEALLHKNYALLTWDGPVYYGGWLESWTGQTKEYEPTISGKLSAIGFAFAQSAGKLDNLLGTAAVKEILGASQAAADMAKAVLGASKVAQTVSTAAKKAK